MTDGSAMKVAVAVASLGRPGNLRALLERLSLQSQLPFQVVLSMEKPSDCPDLSGLHFDVETVFGPRGSSVQRNRALDRLSNNADIVAFYDDDFVPSILSIQGIAETFAVFGRVNSITGLVLKDGVNGPGISAEEATEIVNAWDADRVAKTPEIIEDRFGCYGCNMAFRVSAVGKIRFDESLKGYAWFEDLDFSARVPGRCIQTNAFAGVHCGEKAGREKSGRPLGYAQVANSIYLWRKGSLPFRFTFSSVLRHIAKNHIRMLHPEPWVDRKGRTIGNWAAIRDMIFAKKFLGD